MYSRVALVFSALVVGSVALAHPPGHRPAAPAAPRPQPGVPAQPGPPGRNLQVLPADIAQERLLMIMRHWSQALGVQCSYCHVPPDFASDANPHKNIARGMVRMTIRINQELLPPVVGPSEEARVNCYACHRGQPIPDIRLPEQQGAQGQGAQPTPPPAHIAPDTPAKPH